VAAAAACRGDKEARGSCDLGPYQDIKIIGNRGHRVSRYGVRAVRRGGLQVTGMQEGPGGAVEVWAVTDWSGAAACPDCEPVSSKMHETVLGQSRDVRRAGDQVDLYWVKARRKCVNAQCPRGTVTEWVPQVPPQCTITRGRGWRG
jgi:hypothetical protein